MQGTLVAIGGNDSYLNTIDGACYLQVHRRAVKRSRVLWITSERRCKATRK